MKKFRFCCLLLCVLLTLQCVVAPAWATGTENTTADTTETTTVPETTGVVYDIPEDVTGNAAVANGCSTIEGMQPLVTDSSIAKTAKGAFLYDMTTGTVLYAKNPDAKLYPASLTKIMTALIVLENLTDLEEMVEVSVTAVADWDYDATLANLVPGEQMSVLNLLYCLMVESANDAGAVLAEHVAGSQEAFSELMNQKAAQLGCVGTHFSNAHGLHDENNYTTARDICRLLDFAMDIPEFRTLFCAESYTVPATNKSEERKIFTSNYMMSRETVKKYYDERVTGGKTGATDEAGRCLAATAAGNGMDLLTIVMGAEPVYEEDGLSVLYFGSFEETSQLLDYAFEKFECRQVFSEDQTISQHPVENGANAVVTRPADAAYTVLPRGVEINKLTWIYGDSAGAITAPWKLMMPCSSAV